MYRVIIIEDDPMVADIDRRYVENTPDFSVEAVFQNGAQALVYLKDHDVPLIVLDYYTPVMNGMEFLDALHGTGRAPAVIMVTSAGDAQTVRQMACRGVADYLVKPFEYQRFRQALDRFRQSREQWDALGGALRQEEIDALLSAKPIQAAPSQLLSKGLNENTLQMLRRFLTEHRGRRFTSEELAAQVGLSRITVRRYMSFLSETGELASTIDYQTGGRPAIEYQYKHFP